MPLQFSSRPWAGLRAFLVESWSIIPCIIVVVLKLTMPNSSSSYWFSAYPTQLVTAATGLSLPEIIVQAGMSFFVYPCFWEGLQQPEAISWCYNILEVFSYLLSRQRIDHKAKNHRGREKILNRLLDSLVQSITVSLTWFQPILGSLALVAHCMFSLIMHLYLNKI